MTETIFNYIVYVAYDNSVYSHKWLAKCPGIPRIEDTVLDEQYKMYKVTNIVWMNSDNTIIAEVETLNKTWTLLPLL